MEIRPIRTDKDHRDALIEIDTCWGAPEGTEEGDRLDVLLALVEIYEAKRWPIDIDKSFDPIDVLNYAIEESGIPRQNWPSFWIAVAHRKFSYGGAREDRGRRTGAANSFGTVVDVRLVRSGKDGREGQPEFSTSR